MQINREQIVSAISAVWSVIKEKVPPTGIPPPERAGRTAAELMGLEEVLLLLLLLRHLAGLCELETAVIRPDYLLEYINIALTCQ